LGLTRAAGIQSQFPVSIVGVMTSLPIESQNLINFLKDDITRPATNPIVETHDPTKSFFSSHRRKPPEGSTLAAINTIVSPLS
jgi:hypothetical protein